MIYIRCDANSLLGMGHLLRSHAIAEALYGFGYKCTMVGPLLSIAELQIDVDIYDGWVEMDWDERDEASKLTRVSEGDEQAFWIIDDFRADEYFQEAFRKEGSRWLQLHRPYDAFSKADIIHCANPMAAIAPSTNVKCRQKHLMGLAYSLIRSEFLSLPKRRRRFPPRKILMNFGGGDDRGAIEFLLKTLPHASWAANSQWVIVSGANNPRNATNQDLISGLSGVSADYLVQPPNMAEVINESDMAVLSGGTVAYEAAYCGLPMLLLSIADNQNALCRAFSECGIAHDMGDLTALTSSELVANIDGLDVNACLRMSEGGSSRINGDGAKHVAQAVLEFIEKGEA